MNEKDLNELGTKLGDISAYLAQACCVCGDDITISEDVRKDLKEAFKLVNELYSKYIQYDASK